MDWQGGKEGCGEANRRHSGKQRERGGEEKITERVRRWRDICEGR